MNELHEGTPPDYSIARLPSVIYRPVLWLMAICGLLLMHCGLVGTPSNGELFVIVVDAESEPVGGAEIRVTPGGATATTNEQGVAFLDKLDRAELSVEAVHPLGYSSTETIDLRGEEEGTVVIMLGTSLSSPTLSYHYPSEGSENSIYVGDTLLGAIRLQQSTFLGWTYELISDRDGNLLSTPITDQHFLPRATGFSEGKHNLISVVTNPEQESDSVFFSLRVLPLPTPPQLLSATETAEGHRFEWTASVNKSFDKFLLEIRYDNIESYTFDPIVSKDPNDTVYVWDKAPYGLDITYRIVEQLTDHPPVYSNSVTVATPAEYVSLPGSVVDIVPAREGSMLYVLTAEDAALHFVNTQTLRIERSVPLPERTYDMSLTPSGTELFFASSSENAITVVSTVTQSIDRTIPVPVQEPSQTGYSSYVDALAYPFVAYSGYYDYPQSVVVANYVTGEPIDTFPLGSFQHELTVSPDGSAFYVNLPDRLEEYSLTQGRYTKTFNRQPGVSLAARGIATSDGAYLIYDNQRLDRENLRTDPQIYPEPMLAANRDASRVLGHNAVYDGQTGKALLYLPIFAYLGELDASGKTVLYTSTYEIHRRRIYRLTVPE